MMPAAKTNPLTATDIMAWLRQNPDFLLNHPDAFDGLTLPGEKKAKGVADFQTYLMDRLKRDKESMMNTARDLIEVSRANMNNVGRIHDATLKVLEARNFSAFIQAITMDSPTILDVDVAALVVEGSAADMQRLNVPGLKVVPQGSIHAIMGGATVQLQSDIQGNDHIYGGAARLVRSQVVMRVDISEDTPPALIAFGSRDPDMFAEGQGTDLIGYYVRVVERCFRLWLSLPA